MNTKILKGNLAESFHRPKIKIADIVVGDRLRAADPVWVEALAKMIEESGLLQPVVIWMDGDTPRLVAGLHRMEAYKLNEQEEIPYTLSDAKTYDEARTDEIIENVGRNELNALDRAHHLAELKEVYERRYPETKKGGDVKSEEAKEARKNQTAIFSFSSEIGDKIGLSERAIRMSVAIWKGLSDDTKKTIAGTWLTNHQAGLQQLASEKPAKQKKVCDMLFSTPPKAMNVSDALFILEHGRLLSHVEKKFQGLNKAISSLKDKELDAVLAANEERIMAWVERKLGGAK